MANSEGIDQLINDLLSYNTDASYDALFKAGVLKGEDVIRAANSLYTGGETPELGRLGLVNDEIILALLFPSAVEDLLKSDIQEREMLLANSLFLQFVHLEETEHMELSYPERYYALQLKILAALSKTEDVDVTWEVLGFLSMGSKFDVPHSSVQGLEQAIDIAMKHHQLNLAADLQRGFYSETKELEARKLEQVKKTIVYQVYDRVQNALLSHPKPFHFELERFLPGMILGFDYHAEAKTYLVYTKKRGIVSWTEHDSYLNKQCPECPMESKCKDVLNAIMDEYCIQLSDSERSLHMTKRSIIIFNRISSQLLRNLQSAWKSADYW